MRLIVSTVTAFFASGLASFAQTHGTMHGGAAMHHQPATPYSGMQKRKIKALSPEDLADLRAGRGMGLALAAELHRFPGPMHVLELADQLGLDRMQRERVQEIMTGMKSSAIAAGEMLIARESDLDKLFASAAIDDAQLNAAMRAIGLAQAATREAHLRAHIATRAVLTSAQIARYNTLRGYD